MNSFANGGVIQRMMGFFLASLIEAKRIPAHSQLAEEFFSVWEDYGAQVTSYSLCCLVEQILFQQQKQD